jgi:hypothetical protein
MNHLKEKRVKKIRMEGSCHQCMQPIPIGTFYSSVVYDDGFRKKLYGSFHIDCFQIHLVEKEQQQSQLKEK